MLSFWKEVNENLEEKTEKFLIEEFYYILQISSVFSYMRGKWFYFSIVHFLIFQSVMIFAFFQFLYTTYLIKEDMSVAALSFHVAGGLGVSITTQFILSLNRQPLIVLSNLLVKQFYDYGPSYDTTESKIWLTEMSKFKKIVLIGLIVILSITALQGLVLGQIQDEIQGYATNKTFINDVYMPAPLPLWFPFEPNFYFTFIYELFVVFALLTVLCSGIIMILFYMQAINVQLRILSHSIENIEERALFLCRQYPGFPKFKKRMQLYQDERFIKQYMFCLSQNVEHHNIILSSSKAIDTIQKWPMFNVVFYMSLVMACSFFVVIKGEDRVAPLLLSLLLFIMELFALYFICWRGQELIDENNRLFKTIYSTYWFHCPKKIAKMMFIMQERCKRPLCVKAGGFTEINWELFGSVINSAYSYFNLLLAMKENDFRRK